MVYAFSAGGYFPGATAAGVVVLGSLLLGFRLFRGSLSPSTARSLRAAVAAAVLLAVWTLLSAVWSGAPWRAVVEFDRVALYALALTSFAALAASRPLLSPMVRGLAGACVLVCAAALAARLLPGLYPFAADFDGFGLAYPVTYANALGLLAVLGLILCLHLAGDGTESAPTRLLGAAAAPLLATTLALSGSSGAAVAGAFGIAVYAIATRPAGLPRTAVATAPTAAAAVASALGAAALAGADAGSPAAAQQGREVAVVVVLCSANAALLNWVLMRWRRVWPRAATRVAATTGGVALMVGAGFLVAGYTGGPSVPSDAPSARTAAPNASQSGYAARIDHWRVAAGGFAAAPLLGGGAGTYETLSQRERSRSAVRDAHSLPLETLAELGVLGGVLLAAVLAGVFAGLIAGARGRPHGPYGVVLAVAATWTARAAIDWDWEMPVVTLPVFALCGAALGGLGRERGETPAPRVGGPDGARADLRLGPAARAAAAAALLALITAAGAIAISEPRLVRSAAAARTGDCAAAAPDSLSLAWLRPEPHAVVGRCELWRARRATGSARRASTERAIVALSAAARRDPANRDYAESVRRARRVARADGAR